MNKNPEFIEELLKLLSAADQSKINLCILKAQQQNQENSNLIFDLGVQLARFNRLSDALTIFTALLNNVKNNIKLLYNIGLIYSLQGRHQDALNAYLRALEINSNDVETLINISSTYMDLKNFSLALEVLDKAISLNPEIAEPWSNKGMALSNLGRYEESLSSLNHAIKIDPNHIGALSNKVALCHKRNNLSEALELQSRVIDLCPSNPKLWLDKGDILCKLENFEDGIDCYDKALAIEPSYVEGYLNKGVALSQLKKFNEALKQYDQVLSIQPTHSKALFNKGVALYKLGVNDEAVLLTGRALELNPNLADGWLNRGMLLDKLKYYPDAIDHFERALELNSELDWVDGNLLHSRMMICKWSGLDRSLNTIIDKVQSGKKVINPFALSALIDNGNLIKYCAEICANRNQEITASKKLIVNGPKKNRITIGYFSANFHNHAIGYLISELFKLHDKNNFELIGFSFGPSQNDETRSKISKEFDQFYEVSNISDFAIVEISRKLKIDIAIDLIGFTEDIQSNVFAIRAAPIQINYLGYPGTMGAEYYDYILADKTIIPNHLQVNFSEKVAYLPNCYQVNDRERIISEKTFLRHELNLPSTGFVFTCFNNNYKILPSTFQMWMRILREVGDSVLWLLADNTDAKDNLIKEAAKHGIDASRLVFAERMNREEHLARHKQADLFLDTFPYNAHTTGSDALWAGVPMVTLIGNSFASRVAASLLNAVGLPELITTTQDQYEALAIELALNPEKLSAIKVKLAKNKLTEPLFNTPLFTSNLESLYTKMYNRYHDGLEPDHISLS